MEKFIKLKGIAAPFNILNVDTDKIIPKQFLTTIKRTGLGKHLFDEMRYFRKYTHILCFNSRRELYHDADNVWWCIFYNKKQIVFNSSLGAGN